MRRTVCPLLLFAALCWIAASAQSQPAPGGGYNFVLWSAGSPSVIKDGVNVSVDLKPTTGYTCTEVTLRVIEKSTGKTLGEYEKLDPGKVASKAFTGIPANVELRITAEATFQNGGAFDFKSIEIYLLPAPPPPPFAPLPVP
jgi:hypothetical protein